MKYLKLAALFVLTSCALAACQNCVDCIDCSGPFSTDYEGSTICQDDLGNKALYNAAVSLAEDDNLGGGCICN